jgi:hypothetical protein
MNIELSKEDLINLVKSVSPSSMQECIDNTNKGLMTFTGNQHNERWSWVDAKLDGMSDGKLYNLYIKHKL